MTHNVVHGFDIPALPQGEPAPDEAACTLTVMLRDSRGALGRIAAMLHAGAGAVVRGGGRHLCRCRGPGAAGSRRACVQQAESHGRCIDRH